MRFDLLGGALLEGRGQLGLAGQELLGGIHVTGSKGAQRSQSLKSKLLILRFNLVGYTCALLA
jgi:hypothetical protein